MLVLLTYLSFLLHCWLLNKLTIRLSGEADHLKTADKCVLPERDYVTFGYRLSQIRLSVCHLSVCKVRAPYSAGWNLRRCFYAILYYSHSLSSVQNFTEMSQGTPPLGVKRKRGSQIWRFWICRRLYFKRYNRFVQNLVTIAQIHQSLRMFNYVEFSAGLHLPVQNV